MNDYDRNSDPPTRSEEPTAKRRKANETTTSYPPREVGLMRSIPGDKISSFVGSSSGVYFIRSVYSAFRAHPHTTVPIRSSGSDIVPGEDDHLPSASPNVSKRLWRDQEISTHENQSISFQKLVEWSRSYFSNWHPAYPFLHAPAILALFEKLSLEHGAMQLTTSNFDLVILRSVMSISLADRRQYLAEEEEPYPSEIVFQSYDDAINSVQHAFSQPVSMQSLQAALSVQLFLVSMLRFNAASRLGGLIIRMALQMGLHRCPQRYPSFSPAQRELRHRVFFSLYCIDRFICQSTGLPLSLRDDDIDVCYPSVERHAGGQSSTDTRLRLLEFLSRHCHIRGEVMEFKHKCIQHTQRETDQSTIITSKLAKLKNDIDEFIDLDEAEPHTLSPYHRSLLRVIYHEAVISLNRPIIAANSSGLSYEAALQQCIGSARSIITSLHDAIKPGINSSQPFFILLWPSFTWAVWMSAFILFHAAHTDHVSTAMVTRLSEKSLEILEHLARRGSVWPEACGAAIKDLRTQLMRNGNKKSIYDRSRTNNQASQSPYDMVYPHSARDVRTTRGASATSPHVITRTPSEVTVPIQADVNQERFAEGSTIAPVCRADARTTQTGRSGDPCFDSTLGEAGTNFGPQPSDPCGGASSPEGLLQSVAGLDQSFQFSHIDDHDTFSGFDIPFWLGQDQYSGMVNEWC